MIAEGGRASEFYKKLPPQAGLYEKEEVDVKELEKENQAKKIIKDSEFKVLSLEEELEKARNTPIKTLEEEDEVYDKMEQQIVKQEGEVFQKEYATITADFNLVGEG